MDLKNFIEFLHGKGSRFFIRSTREPADMNMRFGMRICARFFLYLRLPV